MIKSFFLRPSWALISFSSITLALVTTSILTAPIYLNWLRQSAQYEKWAKSEAPQICANAEAICFSEEKIRNPRVANDTFHWRQPWEDVEWETCFRKNNVKQVYCNIYDPESLSTYYSHSSGAITLPLFFVIFSAPFFLFFSARRFFALNHRGWQRVTLIGSVLLSPVLFYICFDDREIIPAAILSIIFFIILISLPATATDFYLWIREGFDKPSNDATYIGQPKTIAPPQLQPLSLTWKTVKPVIATGAVILFIGFSLTFRPESAIKTLVLTFVQAGAIGLAVFIYRFFKK